MRKPILLLSILALAGLSASARSLSPKQALERALDRPVVSNSRSSSEVVPVMTVGSDDAPAIYVFNRPEGGWMIVAANDVAAPVIGYSDSGTLDPKMLPDSFRDWLEMQGRQIDEADAAGAPEYEATSRSASREEIAPMLKTMWDQRSPFNRFCPNYYPSGCVATAMAQVMNYYEWPDRAGDNAMLTYKWQSGNQTLSYDFRGFEFDWKNMVDRYNLGCSETQNDAVARLMQACGYSVQMNYGGGGSAAVNTLVGYALATYFKYDQSLHNELRDYYTAAEWNEMIYDNLKNYGPTVYWGTGSIGHCFVCDGYDGKGYYHFNWGWTGAGDGYFLLNALNPSVIGTGGGTGGYNSAQGALLGVKRADGQPSEKRYSLIADKLQVRNTDTWLFLDGTFSNTSPFTVHGQGVWSVYNEDGSEYIASFDLLSPSFADFNPNDTKFMLQGDISASKIGEGVYRVYPAINVDGTEYRFKTPPSQPDYIIFTRKKVNGSIVTTAELPQVGEKMIEDLSTKGDIFLWNRFRVTGVAKFTGEASVTMSLLPMILDASGKEIAMGSERATITFTPEGQPFDKVFLSLLDIGDAELTPGEYTLAMSYEDEVNGGYRHVATCPVTVKPYENSDYGFAGLKVADSNAVDPEEIKLTAVVNGLKGFTCTDIFFKIQDSDGKTVWGGDYPNEQRAPLYVSAGMTEEVNVTASLPEALPGEVYNAIVYKKVKGSPTYPLPAVSFTIAGESGITDVIADGENDAPVEYYNLQGQRVGSENLAPGIYIRRQGTKTTKILVK